MLPTTITPDNDNKEELGASEIGRRVYCKGDDSSQRVSRKISMAALPDSNQGFPVRMYAKRKDAVNVAVKATAIATARLAMQTKSDKEKDLEPIDLVCIPFFRENRNELSLQVLELDRLLGLKGGSDSDSDSDDDDNDKDNDNDNDKNNDNDSDSDSNSKNDNDDDNDDDDNDTSSAKLIIEPKSTTNFNVGGKTDISVAAGAIAGSSRNHESVVLQAIGSVAVFNAIRSVAVAREYLEEREDGIDLFVKAEFTEVILENSRQSRSGDKKDGSPNPTTAVKLTCFLYKGIIELEKEVIPDGKEQREKKEET